MKLNSLAIIPLFSLLLTLGGCANMVGVAQQQPIAEDTTSRTTGSLIDDELIEVKALVNISKSSQELEQSHISVTSYNGIVLISGQVANEQSRQLAEKVVSKIRKVRKIHNELTIAGPTSAIVRTNDSWLTAKIKSKMLVDKQLMSMRIKVVTENGVVFLLGLVTNEQSQQAVNIARNTAGVQKVVKMFEYVR